jgi:hypothetical protein
MKKPLDFDFTRALARGHVSYDAKVGTWWEQRSADDAHRRAYRHSAEHVRDSLRKAKVKSPLIVDYACGSFPTPASSASTARRSCSAWPRRAARRPGFPPR